MCEICKLEKGQGAFLECDVADVKMGDTVIDERELSVSIYKDEDGYYYLESGYHNMNKINIMTIRTRLDFCPFCGEEFKHKPKLKLSE